jgi:hypothetical protein
VGRKQHWHGVVFCHQFEGITVKPFARPQALHIMHRLVAMWLPQMDMASLTLRSHYRTYIYFQVLHEHPLGESSLVSDVKAAMHCPDLLTMYRYSYRERGYWW